MLHFSDNFKVCINYTYVRIEKIRLQTFLILKNLNYSTSFPQVFKEFTLVKALWNKQKVKIKIH